MKKILLTILFCSISTLAVASTIVNDGNINWNGNWQQTGQVKTPHASTNLNVDSGTSQYSVAWDGDGARDDLGCIVFLSTVTTPATSRTVTISLEEDDNDDGNWADAVSRASTTIVLNSDSKLLTYYYFKYGSAFSNEEAGTANYRIKLSSDNAADTGFRADNASTSNIFIIQVLSATEACDTTDIPWICGYATAATGNPTSATVTYNVETGANTGGDDGDGVGLLSIGNAGILAFPTTASKNYYLEIIGNLILYAGGEFDAGTSGGAIPSTSTVTVEFEATAWRNVTVPLNATLKLNGATITKETTPAGNIAANDKVFTLTASTGWKVGDRIWLGRSGGTSAEYVTITGIIGANYYIDSVGDGSGATPKFAYAHNTSAWVYNVSSNVTFTGSTGGMIIGFAGTIEISQARLYKIIHNFSNTPFYWSNPNAGYIEYTGMDSIGTAGDSYINGTLTTGHFSYNFLDFTNDVNRQHFSITPSGLSGTFTAQQNIFYSAWGGTFAWALHLNASGCVTPQNGLLYVKDNKFESCGGAFLLPYDYFLQNDYIRIEGGYVSNCNCVTTGDGYSDYSVYAKIYNMTFGSPQANTNDIAMGNIDYITEVLLYNCTMASATEVATNARPYKTVRSQNHDGINGRYKTWISTVGIISDPTTAGVTTAYSKGGSGDCIYFAPALTTAGSTLNLEFYIPVTASTDPALKMYITKTTAGFDGTVTVTVYDSDDNITVLDTTAVTIASIPVNDGVGSDWTYQYEVTLDANPTITGFCRVQIAVLDGATVGDILIDDISFASGGATYTDSCDRSADGLPLIFGAGGAAPGGGVGSISVSTNF